MYLYEDSQFVCQMLPYAVFSPFYSTSSSLSLSLSLSHTHTHTHTHAIGSNSLSLSLSLPFFPPFQAYNGSVKMTHTKDS